MNKQELIEKVIEWGSWLVEDGEKDRYVKILKVRELINQLDEPQKPVVPKFVAEYLNYCMANEWTLGEALTTGKFQFPEYLYKAVDWLNDSMNQNIFAQAWLFGYEVEKEPQYMVPLLTDKEGNKKILVERRESTTSFGIMRMRTTGMSC
ncbi:ASCH domain protein [Enterococcus faecium]|uniref:DUF1642 domain-containing protein n=1 Tax=Enterococcus faecium TaxID=1352 RepID=UPI000A183E4D|nr:DUF1642 domain-containing protein [Enterococcus faecium]EHK2906841.1 DUF1642 domain-containing protein [Enterococcus faecium]SML56138.1 ASCH domain protein [Enterococcus faecium]